MSSDVFAPGEVFGGKYRVVRTLGEGGMAVVLEATHIKLGHKVALKVLREGLATNESIVARFEREGRALGKIRSPNCVRVFDVDTAPTGLPFLVMEYLEGVDMEVELRHRGALPIGEAVGYVIQACGAMLEAHALGIVHRDLKPTNLFLATEGTSRVVKVLDFGIATDAPVGGEARLTRTEVIMGTPVYMAPEQFRSAKDIDARVDVWALGATLYELLTGVPPFTGTATTIGVSIVTDDVRPIEASRADVPPALRGVVLKALEKDRAMRFPSMLAFVEALRPFGDGVVIAPRSSAHSFHDVAPLVSATTLIAAPGAPLSPSTAAFERAAPPATGAAVTQEAEVRPQTRPSPARSWSLGIVAAAVLLLGAAGFVVARSNASRPVVPSVVPLPVLASPTVSVAPPLPALLVPPATESPATAVSAVSAEPSSLVPPPQHHPSRGVAGLVSSSHSAPPVPARAAPDSSGHPLFFPR
jgi:serine/threonine protein kinase